MKIYINNKEYILEKLVKLGELVDIIEISHEHGDAILVAHNNKLITDFENKEAEEGHSYMVFINTIGG